MKYTLRSADIPLLTVIPFCTVLNVAHFGFRRVLPSSGSSNR